MIKPEGLVLTFFRTHMREQDNVADARGIGQQHYQAVDTDTATAGGRQAVFHGADVVGVVVHGFIVAGFFLSHL